MHLSWIRMVIGLGVALALSACAHRYSPPEMHPPDAAFPGLWDALAQNAEADFLYVHGICHHTVADAADVFTRVAAPLGMDVRMDPDGEPIGVHGGMLHRGTMRGHDRTVRLFAILWSPITATPKRALCFDVVGGNHICPSSDATAVGSRAKLNGALKDELLDECLADAVFYAGDTGHQAIGAAVQDALVRLLPREPGHDRPLVVYTESLGSKILFDALDDPKHWATATFAGWYQRPVQVFMGANQLPLLSLATDPTLATAGAAQPAISGVQRQANRIAHVVAGTRPLGMFAKPNSGQRLVVAFDDPNDLLGYKVRPYGPAHPDVAFIDVLVSNATEYLGLIESPLAAHTRYRDNPDVLRLIACGSRAAAPGCPAALPALR